MGDISVIARRLEGGKRVQYGWSGNGGYCRNTGLRLIEWYDNADAVEYLFSLGQLGLIGKSGSEKGGEPLFYSHDLTGEPHWIGKSEREIFNQIAFVDYGYFYDSDDRWYYIIPGPFRIKVPLTYMLLHLNENGYEHIERIRLSRLVAEYILSDYYKGDEPLRTLVQETYPQGIDEIRKDVMSGEYPCHQIWEQYRAIYDYLDDWVVVKTTEDMQKVDGIIVHLNQRNLEPDRVETIHW